MTEDIKKFEAYVPELRAILARRKSSWTLSILEWDDVEMILLTRLWAKFHLYKSEKGPIENWANRLISNTLSNLLRDNLFIYARPCVASGPSGGSCCFNEGNNMCGFTKSGKQCEECPLFAKWKKKKEAAYNINSSLPLDYHSQEVQNLQEDFLDVEAAKRIIDTKIMLQLNSHDAKIYRLLFIEHLSMEEVGKKMKYKISNNSNVSQVLRKLVIRFKELAKRVIEDEDLC